MKFVIVDLEATCWEKNTRPDRMEIIEIGAVMVHPGSPTDASEFQAFVRPVAEPTLSEFCTKLTSIRQEDVDRAEPFPVVFPRFLEWIGEAPYALCSWGMYDLRQFEVDCRRHGVELPASFRNHINLKTEFALATKIKPRGLRSALRLLEIPLEGTHHRALDDARNIARLTRGLLEARGEGGG